MVLWFPILLIIVLLCSANMTWAPFQSAQVKTICAHMTAEERWGAIRLGAIYGMLLGGFFVAIGFVGMLFGSRFFGSMLMGMIVIQPAVLISVFIFARKLRPWSDRMQKEFLASTRWAQEQGISSDNIALRR